MRERELYHTVVLWLKNFLQRHYRRAKNIIVEDTSRSTVATFLTKHRLLQWQREGETYDIKVDITGAVVLPAHHQPVVKLAIIEVKAGSINLRSFSQALGYAKVVHPDHAFLISPKGWSTSLHRLVRDFNRTDILEYVQGQYIVVAKWDLASSSIRPGEVLTYGLTL